MSVCIQMCVRLEVILRASFVYAWNSGHHLFHWENNSHFSSLLRRQWSAFPPHEWQANKKRNWICQSNTAAAWGWVVVQRLAGQQGKYRWRRQKKGWGAPFESTTTHSSLSAHCPEALCDGYRGVQLLCFVVCLYQGQGGDDLSLFVGISGSVMWLWCNYTGGPRLPEPLKVTVDVLVLMCLSILCMHSDCQTCFSSYQGKVLSLVRRTRML